MKSHAHFLSKNLALCILLGISLGAMLCFSLLTEFYFYQVVVITIILAPIVITSLIYSTRSCLLSLLVLTIPFNPSFHLIRNNSPDMWTGLMFHTSDLIMICIFIYLLVSRAMGRGKKYHATTSAYSLSLPLLLWIAAGVVSIMPAFNKFIAIVELIRIIRIFLIFIAVFLIIEKIEDIRLLCTCLAIAFIVQTVLIFAEYILGYPLFRLPGEVREADIVGEILRPGGTMGHSSNFAKLAALCLPILMAFIFAVRENTWRLLIAIFMIAGLSALVLTVSRAGIATSLLGLFWFSLATLTTTRRKQSTTFLLFLFLITGISLAWYFGGNQLLNRIREDSSSALSRPLMYSVAWNIIKEHPFSGVGLNNYTLIAPLYDRTGEAISMTFPYPVHNIYLLYAAEIGIPGLVFFLWFLVRTIFSSFKYSSHTKFLIDSALMKAIGIGITCSWLQGLIGWGFRSSIVHTSYLAVFAGALAAQSYYKQNHI